MWEMYLCDFPEARRQMAFSAPHPPKKLSDRRELPYMLSLFKFCHAAGGSYHYFILNFKYLLAWNDPKPVLVLDA